VNLISTDVPGFSWSAFGVFVAAGWRVVVGVLGTADGIGVTVLVAGLVWVLSGSGSIWIARVPQAEIKKMHITKDKNANDFRYIMSASPFNPVLWKFA